MSEKLSKDELRPGKIVGKATLLESIKKPYVHPELGFRGYIKFWKCSCSCGNIFEVRETSILNGNLTDCKKGAHSAKRKADARQYWRRRLDIQLLYKDFEDFFENCYANREGYKYLLSDGTWSNVNPNSSIELLRFKLAAIVGEERAFSVSTSRVYQLAREHDLLGKETDVEPI